MTEYRIARPEERADIVDFANYVFSQAHRPHDFKTLIPKMYDDQADGDRMARSHYLALENGRIRAMVACPLITMRYADQPLCLGLVGTVSVHPYARGEGHMKHLMALMRQDAAAQGADALALGGQHQRYQYFGFDEAGACFRFQLSSASARHAWGKLPRRGCCLAPLDENPCWISQAYRLWERRSVTGGRSPEAFLSILRTWTATPLAVVFQEECIGYLCLVGDKDVSELVLREEGDLPEVMSLLMKERGLSELELDVMAWETERIRALLPSCETYTIVREELLSVIQWENTLRACLALKASCGCLPDTDAVLELDGSRIRIQIGNGRAKLSACEETPTLTLRGPEAIRTVFSTAASICPALSPLGTLLPLPFALPGPDCF